MDIDKKANKFILKLVKQLDVSDETITTEISLINIFKLVVSQLPVGKNSVRYAIESNLEQYFDLFTKSIEAKKSNHLELTDSPDITPNDHVDGKLTWQSMILLGCDISDQLYDLLNLPLVTRVRSLLSSSKYNEISQAVLRATDEELTQTANELYDICHRALTCTHVFENSMYDNEFTSNLSNLTSKCCLLSYLTIFRNSNSNFDPTGFAIELQIEDPLYIYYYIAFLALWNRKSFTKDVNIEINLPIQLLYVHLKSIENHNYEITNNNQIIPYQLILINILFAYSYFQKSVNPSQEMKRLIQTLISHFRRIMIQIRGQSKETGELKLWQDILYPFIASYLKDINNYLELSMSYKSNGSNGKLKLNNNNNDITLFCPCDTTNLTQPFLDWFSTIFCQTNKNNENNIMFSVLIILFCSIINDDTNTVNTNEEEEEVDDDDDDDDDEEEFGFTLDTMGTKNMTNNIVRHKLSMKNIKDDDASVIADDDINEDRLNKILGNVEEIQDSNEGTNENDESSPKNVTVNSLKNIAIIGDATINELLDELNINKKTKPLNKSKSSKKKQISADSNKVHNNIEMTHHDDLLIAETTRLNSDEIIQSSEVLETIPVKKSRTTKTSKITKNSNIETSMENPIAIESTISITKKGKGKVVAVQETTEEVLNEIESVTGTRRSTRIKN